MDIVIPYLKNNSGELALCLELIKKNFPHRNIYVIEEYEKKDHSHLTHINQILKLKWAVENLDLTEEFYLFNDDFFVLEKVDGTPYFHKGKLTDHIASRSGRDYYTRTLEITSEILGEDALSYEMHLPFLLNKMKLLELIESMDTFISSGRCPLIRSMYGNTYQVGGVYREDVKNIENYTSSPYLSTTESSFRRKYGDYIRSKL